jgi:hypothetical protein
MTNNEQLNRYGRRHPDQAEREQLLTNEELAERARVTIATVRGWRYNGKGPRALKLGRHVRYRLADIRAWEEANAE